MDETRKQSGRSRRMLTLGLVIAVSLTTVALVAAETNGPPGLATAKAKVAALYRGQFFKQPPATSPKPQRGKNVWQISVGLALPASVLYADAVRASAKALGWKLHVYDGKFSSQFFQEGIQQAIADKADGIILYNVDCPLAESAMKQAKAANIPIVGGESLDCSYFKKGAPSLFSGAVVYTQGDFATWSRSLGAVQADWVIAKTGGKAKTIVFTQKDLQFGVLTDQGFRKEFKICSGCKVARTVQFSSTDLGPKLQQKAEQAILQTPEADSIVVPYDDLMTAGVAAAVNSSGRKNQLQVIAGGGYAPNLDLVRENRGQDAGYTSSIPWEGYAAADTLNRIFAGQKPANSGNGVGLYDQNHNLPASGPAQYPVDFAAAYKRAWARGRG